MGASTLVFYDKKTCGTCKKAKAFLDDHGVAYEVKPIETEPPSKALLESVIVETDIKKSLNSRSKIYREEQLGKNLPDKLRTLALMEKDPNLIKRPFIVNAKGAVYQGFNAEALAVFLES